MPASFDESPICIHLTAITRAANLALPNLLDRQP